MQAEKTRRYLVREMTAHTIPSSSIRIREPIGGATHQGYTNGSTWTCGTSLGVYGFALAYQYTGDRVYLETSNEWRSIS